MEEDYLWVKKMTKLYIFTCFLLPPWIKVKFLCAKKEYWKCRDLKFLKKNNGFLKFKNLFFDSLDLNFQNCKAKV